MAELTELQKILVKGARILKSSPPPRRVLDLQNLYNNNAEKLQRARLTWDRFLNAVRVWEQRLL